jgi:hypothetical protein
MDRKLRKAIPRFPLWRDSAATEANASAVFPCPVHWLRVLRDAPDVALCLAPKPQFYLLSYFGSPPI